MSKKVLHHNMVSTAIILVSLLASMDTFGGSSIYNVIEHGAVGDGETDETQLFQEAFRTVCSSTEYFTILVPLGKTFMLNTILFEGPCESKIHFMINGNIVAPNELQKQSKDEHWITFKNINDLVIDGTGVIDGRGHLWWGCQQSNKCQQIPDTFAVLSCLNVKLNGLTFKDSPAKHVTIGKSVGVQINTLNINAPEYSPNTDGIHIQTSQHIEVTHCRISTGDDCISIGTQTSDVNISYIDCGPGHGISIGSLGEHRSQGTVEEIHISDCHFYKTLAGARIKTWPGGSGYVRAISFQNLNFTSVKNPIIIDQYYCDKGHGCPSEPSAIHVNDVRFVRAFGSSIKELAIILNCSERKHCTDIFMENIQIKSEASRETKSYCINAHGLIKDPVIPEVSCLESGA